MAKHAKRAAKKPDKILIAAERLQNIFSKQKYDFSTAMLTRDEVAAAQDLARLVIAERKANL